MQCIILQCSFKGFGIVGDVIIMDAQHSDHEGDPSAGAHAHDAHVHEGQWTSPLGIDDAIAQQFFHWWEQFTAEIDGLNARKAAMVKNLRASYGPYHAEALKRACNLALKDAGKVAKDDVLNKAARDYLSILRGYP